MVLKKQTIWLLTMLTLMVALSAYYLLSGENDEIAITENNPYSQMNDPSKMNGQLNNGHETDMGVDSNTTQTISDNIFSTMRIERDRFRSQLIEKYHAVVESSKDNNAVAEASAKIDELDQLEGSETFVESLIKAKEGYSDAVVFTQDNRVNVVVQKKDLTTSEAVSIINLVAKNLNVPGTNVIVNNTP